MICMSVYDANVNSRNQLREWIADYLLRAGKDMDILWFTKGFSEEKIDGLSVVTHVALVSLDDKAGIEIGRKLYKQNSDCRIFYYSEKQQDAMALLPTRPVCIYLWSEGKEAFQQKLGMALNDLLFSQNIFYYETKKEIFLIPYRDIMYLQSDLKHVRIHHVSAAENVIFAKLSQLEIRLDSRFIRIHKSYIVNFFHVHSIDKKNHMIKLLNGEVLPVSDAQYGMVVAKFRDLGNTNMR